MDKSATIQARINPFEINTPNEITQKTLKESENGVNLHQVNNVNGLFEELNC